MPADSEFEIQFYEKVILARPDYIEALLPLAEAYTQKGMYEQGLVIDERLAKLCPQDSNVYYNLACSYALLNRTQEALAALHKAVELGYTDFKHLRKDSDLKSLYVHPEFQILAKKG